MNIFNTNGLDEEYIEELEKSFRNINFEKEIADDLSIRSIQKIFKDLNIKYNNIEPVVVNAFKVHLDPGAVFIIQTCIDNGYAYSLSHGQKDLGKDIQVWALALSKIDLGLTYLKPESLSDKINDLWNKDDIDFKNSIEFSQKYFLSSSKKQDVAKTFNKEFLDTIAKYDEFIMIIKSRHILAGFPDDIYTVKNVNSLIDILGKASFVERNLSLNS